MEVVKIRCNGNTLYIRLDKEGRFEVFTIVDCQDVVIGAYPTLRSAMMFAGEYLEQNACKNEYFDGGK